MRVLLSFAALLASSSCAMPPQHNYGAAQPFPGHITTAPIQPVQAARVRGGPVTSYVGRGDGSELTLRLTSLPGGQTLAEGGTQGDGMDCGGAFTGKGTFRGKRLTVLDKNAPTCPINIVRDGRRLTVEADSQGCFALHGARCVLSGQLTQR